MECSDESNIDSTANGAEGRTALEDPTVDETTTTSFPEEDSLPPSGSASVSASDQDSTSLQEEPPTKKIKQDK